jgi:hypothetical protein
MTYFQRKRIKQITRLIERDSLVKKDVDELLERFLLSKWTAAISLAVLVAAVVFAILAMWSIFTS